MGKRDRIDKVSKLLGYNFPNWQSSTLISFWSDWSSGEVYENNFEFCHFNTCHACFEFVILNFVTLK